MSITFLYSMLCVQCITVGPVGAYKAITNVVM